MEKETNTEVVAPRQQVASTYTCYCICPNGHYQAALCCRDQERDTQEQRVGDISESVAAAENCNSMHQPSELNYIRHPLPRSQFQPQPQPTMPSSSRGRKPSVMTRSRVMGHISYQIRESRAITTFIIIFVTFVVTQIPIFLLTLSRRSSVYTRIPIWVHMIGVNLYIPPLSSS